VVFDTHGCGVRGCDVVRHWDYGREDIEMNIELAPELRELLFNRFEKEMVESRKPGIHASDLDLCLGKAFYRKTARLPIPESLMLKYMLGFAFQVYILGVPEEEMEKDGILMSVDAPIDSSYIEFKSTARWYQTKQGTFDPREMKHWMTRSMAYCYTRGVGFCYLAVLFYKQSDPDMVVWRMEFTGDELWSNWEDMLVRKSLLEAALAVDMYPIQDFHEEWECKYCENAIPGRCKGVRC